MKETKEVRQERWSTRRNELKIQAIVQLKKLGWSDYSLTKLLTPFFEDFDKRNVRKVFLKEKDNYNILTAEERKQFIKDLNSENVHLD